MSDKVWHAVRKRKYVLAVLAGIACLLLGSYVGSYLILSRRGHAEADRYGMTGFCYLRPDGSRRWESWNVRLTLLYHPLNVVDRWLGTGRYPVTCFFTIAPPEEPVPGD